MLLGLMILAAAAGLRFAALTTIPPIAWVDEAWFEVRAREVPQGVNVLPTADPVFASGNSPFQMYAIALVQALGAPAAYSSRWVSATLGTLAVAAGGGLLWAVFAEWPAERRRLATLTGLAVLTPLFTGILYSRDGTQNSGCLLGTTVVLLGLYQTLGRDTGLADPARVRWALFTGTALAVILTTYEAALALPLVVLGYYLLLRLVTGARSDRNRRLVLAAGLSLTALGLFAPLLVYYWRHPEVVLTRLTATQNLSEAGGWEWLWRPLAGFARVWWGVAAQGDPLIGQNLSGRPLFDPFLAVLLGIGLAASARAARRSPAAQLFWVAALGLSLPAAVTANPPAFGQMLPLLAPLAGWVAWGAATAWGWSARLPLPRWAMATLLSLGLAASGAASVYDYFLVWARDPRLFDARQVGARQVGEWALAQARSGDVLVAPRSQPLIYYTLRVLLDGTPVQTWDATVEWFPYAHQRPAPTHYGLVTAFDTKALPLLKAAYPAGYAYAVYLTVPAGTPAPAQALDVHFQNGLRLVGIDAPTQARPGETVTVRPHWVGAGPAAAVTSFVHVSRGRASRPLLGQSDGPLCAAFPPERWRAGYRYIEARRLALAADAAPGAYDVRVGLYDPATGIRVSATAAAVNVEDDRAVVRPFEVIEP